jgi:hypothetical protein
MQRVRVLMEKRVVPPSPSRAAADSGPTTACLRVGTESAVLGAAQPSRG